MKKIILDTNFLLIPYQFKVDIFSEIRRICDFNYSLFVIDKTVDELNRIVLSSKVKDRLAAVLALKLIAHAKVKEIKTGKEMDADLLIIKAADRDTIVATQDTALKSRLKQKGAGIISLRKKDHLVIG